MSAVGIASNLPKIIQNDPNCNVQGDLKLQYTQHDFQQAPRQVVAQMVGLKMVLPDISYTNLTNPTGVLTGVPTGFKKAHAHWLLRNAKHAEQQHVPEES